MIISIFLVIAAYLIGSVSSAVVTCKLMGLPDPRTQGSNNPGATNVLRIGGKKAAIITLIGDFMKGLLPVIIAYALGAAHGVVALIGIAAFLGHLYPIFFQFKGGKGVATAAGVMFGWSFSLGLLVLGVWLVIAYFTRYSSLAALICAALSPLLIFILGGASSYVMAAIIITLILFYRHKENIARLRAGTESKINLKK